MLTNYTRDGKNSEKNILNILIFGHDIAKFLLNGTIIKKRVISPMLTFYTKTQNICLFFPIYLCIFSQCVIIKHRTFYPIFGQFGYMFPNFGVKFPWLNFIDFRNICPSTNWTFYPGYKFRKVCRKKPF